MFTSSPFRRACWFANTYFYSFGKIQAANLVWGTKRGYFLQRHRKLMTRVGVSACHDSIRSTANEWRNGDLGVAGEKTDSCSGGVGWKDTEVSDHVIMRRNTSTGKNAHNYVTGACLWANKNCDEATGECKPNVTALRGAIRSRDGRNQLTNHLVRDSVKAEKTASMLRM